MKKKYTFTRDGIEEEVKLERWVWGAIMKDGTELHQFDESGHFHQIGEVDQSRLQMFCLYKPDEPLKRIDMPFSEGMKLVHKYRNVKLWYKEDWTRVYMIGFKKAGQHSLIYVLPDDRIIFSDSDSINLDLFEIK